jgi:hypothetical protein
VAVSTDVVAVAGVALLSLALLLLTWGTWGDLDNDTGYDFVAGLHVAHGAVPYRDFFYWYGPLAPALLGLAFVAGPGIAPAVALGVLVAGATVGATYALARTHAGPAGAALAAALAAPVAFAPNQFSFVIPHAADASLGALGLVLCVLCLERRNFAVAGTIAGVVALTKPEFALAAFVGGAVLLAVCRGRRDALAFAGPALAIPALVYGAFLTQVSAHRLVFENLYPVDFFRIAGNTMLRARFPLTVASFAQLAGYLALYAAATGALVLLARTERRSLRVAAAGCGAVAVAISLARPELLRHGLHFAWGWLPAGAVVAAVYLLYRRRREGLAEAAALAVLAATTYGAFYVEAWSPQMAVYAVPLAASFLVRLHITELRSAARLGALWLAFLAAAVTGLTLKDARAESATVRGPGGALKESPALASVYQRTLDIVVARTRPHEAVLFAPQLTALYALAERDNPLRQISLLPGALASANASREAIARLERAHVRVIVIDRHTYPGYGHTNFGGSFDRRLADWVRTHYKHIATVRGAATSPTLDVWSRRAK